MSLPTEWSLLRPEALWMLLLTPGWIWLLRRQQRRSLSSPWDHLIAPELRSSVLSIPPTRPGRRGLFALGLLLAWLCSIAALAGPSFGQTEVPTIPPTQEAILVLGLSPSMRATDLSPDRLTRARLGLEEWLTEQDQRRVGLVSFASRAYRVSPLTEDMPTLHYLLQALSPDLMPGSGHNSTQGLRLAATMFSQGGGQRDIILVLDQALRAGTIELAAELASQGIRTHVLSVGTTAGAPIPLDNGRFATDGQGQLLMAAVDQAAHQALAQAGRGRWAQLADWDSQSWKDLGPTGTTGLSASPTRDSTIARDDGIWFLLPLALWFAWRVGQGALLSLLLALSLGLSVAPQAAHAADSQWWANPQRQAVQRWQADPEQIDPEDLPPSWAGRALLEQGRPEAAAALLRQSQSLSDRYNAALALARAQQLEAALAGFASILQEAPEFEAAAHNYEVVRQALEQQQQEQEQQQQEQEQQQDNSGEGSEQQSGAGEDSESGEQPPSADSEQQPGAGEQSQSSPENQEPAGADESSAESPNPADQNPNPESRADNSANGAPEDAAESAQELPSLTDPQTNPEQADEAERQIRQWLNRVDSDPARLLRERFRRLDLRAPAEEPESAP